MVKAKKSDEGEDVEFAPLQDGKRIDVKTTTFVDPRNILIDRELNISRWKAESIDSASPRVRELAYKMARFGNKVPVHVCRIGGNLYLAAGYHRHAGGLLIIEGFNYDDPLTGKTVFIHNPNFKLRVVLETGNRRDMMLMNVRENADHEPLSAMDQANIVRNLKDIEGMSNAEIADELGLKDVGYVSQLEKLLTLDDPIQEMIHSKKLSGRAAMDLATLPPEKVAEMVEESEATGKKIKKKDTERALRNHRAETGEGARRGRTAGAWKELHQSLTGPAELKEYSKFGLDMVKAGSGEFTDTQVINRIKALHKAAARRYHDYLTWRYDGQIPDGMEFEEVYKESLDLEEYRAASAEAEAEAVEA